MKHRFCKIAIAILFVCAANPHNSRADDDTADPRGGVPGACCDPATMGCSIRSETSCLNVGGVFAGEGTTCDACVETTMTYEIYGIEDGFELQAAPEYCYGYSGGLSVAGSQARNRNNQVRGIADTWIKFDPVPAVAAFDAHYGIGNWIITNVELKLFEFPTPFHPIFGIGAGHFDIKWFSNDNWSQGVGTPNSPSPATGNQIGFTYGRSLLTSGLVETLGNFQNTLTATYHSFDLALTTGFTADLKTEGPVSLYFVATDTGTGFIFYASSHSSAPIMVITADAAPADVCRGDINADGLIRGDDIPLYVTDFLQSSSIPPAAFDLIDMNDSGLLDMADVACFVEALLASHDCNDAGPFTCP